MPSDHTHHDGHAHVGRPGHPTFHDLVDYTLNGVVVTEQALEEEGQLLNIFGRHWSKRPLERITALILLGLVVPCLLALVVCCCFQPCLVHILRCLRIREHPAQYKQFEEDELQANLDLQHRPRFWWRTPREQESARRQWVAFMYRIGDLAGARRLGWDGVSDPAALDYGRHLSRLMPEILDRCGPEADSKGMPLAWIDTNKLQVRLAREVTFEPGGTSFVRMREGNEDLLRNVAALMLAANEVLEERGFDPLRVAIEVHVASDAGSNGQQKSAEAGVGARRGSIGGPSSRKERDHRALERSLKRAEDVQSALSSIILLHVNGPGIEEVRQLLPVMGLGVSLKGVDDLDLRIMLPKEKDAMGNTCRSIEMRERFASVFSPQRPTGPTVMSDAARAQEWADYFAQVGDLKRALAFGWRAPDEEPTSPTSPRGFYQRVGSPRRPHRRSFNGLASSPGATGSGVGPKRNVTPPRAESTEPVRSAAPKLPIGSTIQPVPAPPAIIVQEHTPPI